MLAKDSLQMMTLYYQIHPTSSKCIFPFALSRDAQFASFHLWDTETFPFLNNIIIKKDFATLRQIGNLSGVYLARNVLLEIDTRTPLSPTRDKGMKKMD